MAKVRLDARRYQMKAESDRHRLQLIEGICRAVEGSGYAATTIADIVGHARVSKRTFYENFDDKEECFLAAYQVLADRTMRAMASAVDGAQPWDQQVEAAVRAYVAALEARPALTRACFLEIHAAGARGLTLRRQVLARFAELFRAFVERNRRCGLRAISTPMAITIVGAINEMMLLAAERKSCVTDVAQTAVELVWSVVSPR